LTNVNSSGFPETEDNLSAQAVLGGGDDGKWRAARRLRNLTARQGDPKG
jgi:hypothetical protein